MNTADTPEHKEEDRTISLGRYERELAEWREREDEAETFIEALQMRIENAERRVAELEDKADKARGYFVSGTTILAGLFTALFVTLKLYGMIAWPWIWVFSPLWLPYAMALVTFGVILLTLLLVAIGTRD